MKRVKHFLLASCLFPTLLGAQEMASAYFLELTPDAQSAGMAGGGGGVPYISGRYRISYHR